MINITHCTLFTTALCNLNCNYCYICKDKAGGLNIIDKDIEECFANKEQIKQILEYDPSIKDTLEHITLWGGEPMLHAERFIDQMEDWFATFPKLNGLDMSTNFSVPTEINSIAQILQKIDNLYHGENQFLVDIQISIDGYEEMNDFGRGAGVTERIRKNFIELCKLNYNYNKIRLFVHTKPTLSKETFHFLDTPEKCYHWFEFLNDLFGENCRKYNVHFSFVNSLFNCASPTEWTVEDGKEFAKIIKNIISVEDKVRTDFQDWQSYDSLSPITNLLLRPFNDTHNAPVLEYGKNFSQPMCGGGCGVFTSQIVPIPHGKFTMCHRGLFDSYTDYCNNIANQHAIHGLSDKYFNNGNISNNWIYTAEEFRKMHNTMNLMYQHPHKIIYTDLITLIREYAIAGIIDKRYAAIKEIEKTLGYFMCNSYCVQDGYIFAGSWSTTGTLEVPLIYNGAMQASYEDFERIVHKKGLII